MFVLQLIVLIILLKLVNRPWRWTLNFMIILLTLSPFIFQMQRSKIPCITTEAFHDLKNFKSHLDATSKTIIIARHGLEWWTGWVLGTHIGQDKAIDAALFEKYKQIIILQQKSGINVIGPGGADHLFHEPLAPPKSQVIYQSDYFDAFLWVGGFKD